MPIAYFPQRSYSYSGIRSPGKVLDTVDRTGVYAVDYELLWQVKAFNGFGANLHYANLPYAANSLGIGTFNPVWNPGVDPHPSQAYRAQFRKRYLNRALTWSYTDSVGSTGSSASLTHSGLLGQATCPKLISGNWPTVGNFAVTDPPTLISQADVLADIIMVGDVASGMIPPTFSENHAWLTFNSAQSNSGTSYSESVSDTIDSEVAFPIMLNTARNRVAARTWPGAFTANQVTNEGFSEFYFGTSASDDYTLYNGTPSTSGIPSPSMYWPNWFPQGLGVASMWLYMVGQGNEEGTGSPSPGDAVRTTSGGTSGTGVEAVRARFRVSKTKPYFIARARIVPQPPGTDATITDVYYEGGGIAHANEVIELDLPTGDNDFVATNDVLGNPTLTWGEVRFAIIDMNPTDWQAASGYTFVH